MTARLERVLVIEDDPDIATVVRTALEHLGGLQVQVCASGEEAVRRAPGFAPDLVLLDAMLPGMDGAATAAALHHLPALGGVPVVFLTARARPADRRAFLALGAAEVIAKPFDPLTLAQRVHDIWLHRRAKR